MLTKTIIKNNILSFKRNKKWQIQIVLKIVLVIFILLLFSNLAFLSYNFDSIVISFGINENPIKVINKYILFYFILLFIIRIFFQKEPYNYLKPYYHLPIKRRKLINFQIIKSLINIYNLLPFLIFLPFCIKVILPKYSNLLSFIWFISLFQITIINNFISIIIKDKFMKFKNILICTFIILFSLILLYFFKFPDIAQVSALIFNGILKNNKYLIFIPIILIISFILIFRHFQSQCYLDSKYRKKTNFLKFINLNKLDKYSRIIKYIILECRLIFRNKRTKKVMFGTFGLLLLGLNFFLQSQINTFKLFNSVMLFLGCFYVSGYIIGYFNKILCWESNYFDLIRTSRININDYIHSKIIFSICFTIIGIILGSIAISFISLKHILYVITIGAYNLGIVYPFFIYTSLKNPTKISLKESYFFNYSAFNSLDWFLELSILIIPLIIIFIFIVFTKEFYGYLFIGATGLLGIIFYKKIITNLNKLYLKQKYQVGNVFRGDN